MHVGGIEWGIGRVEEEEAENEKGGKEEEGKEVQEKEEDKQEDKEEQVDVQEGLDVQGLPGGLDAIVDGACADGVEAEGGAHHRQGVCQTHADAGVVCEAPSAGPGRQVQCLHSGAARWAVGWAGSWDGWGGVW